MNLDTNKEYILENGRVLLRPLLKSDFEYLVPFAKKEPELWNYSLVSANNPENMKKYMDMAFRKKEIGDSYPFIVYDKKTGQYAGSTRFYDIQPVHNTLQLGYTWYGAKFQRTGLNRNCKYLLLQFAFETAGVDRVEFRADANNARSIAAMKGIGCTEEGILRNNCAASEGRRSSIVLSILKEEWHQEVKNMLQTKLKSYD